jgi:hypothetical protein
VSQKFLKFFFLFFLFYFSFALAFDYKIFINEILPSPEGPDDKEEWVEIFNSNDFEVDLSNWKIQDSVGKTKTYLFPKGTKIEAKGYLVLERPETKITLNNEGDELVLFNSRGEVVDRVSYQKAQKGKSYSKTSEGWTWTSNLTPGKENFEPEKNLKEKEPEVPKIEKEKFSASVKEFFQPVIIFLIALSIAIFSAIIFLLLKKKIEKKEDNIY